MSDQNEQMNATVARALIEAERKTRADACMAEINAVLQRHKCNIDIALVLRPGQHPQPIFQIVPVE